MYVCMRAHMCVRACVCVCVVGGRVKLEVSLQHAEFEDSMGQLNKVAPQFF